MKISTKNQKGFIVPAIIALVAILAAGGAYWAWHSNGNNQNTADEGVVASSNEGWKTFSNKDIGIEFQYPAYLGDATITKDSSGCSGMQTLNSIGQYSYVVKFSKKPSVGIGQSSMDYSFGVFIATSTSSKICDVGYRQVENSFVSKAFTKAFTQPSSDKAYVAVRSYDSQAYNSYVLIKNHDLGSSIVDAIIMFNPSYGTSEWSAIGTNDPNKYIDESSSASAKQIRGYFNDFKNIVMSIKFIN